MKEKIFITIFSIIFLISFYSSSNAQDNIKDNVKDNAQNSDKNNNQETSRAEELLKKIDLSKYSTPFYLQYVADDDSARSIDWLINQAMQNNKGLISIRQKKDVLQARRIQAALRPNPKIDIEFLTDELSNRNGEYDLSATYSQPIERGKKREKRIKVVDLELAQLEKEVLFQEQNLRLEITTQYINALANCQYLEFLEKLVKLNEENFKIVEVKFKEGDVAKLDLQLSEVELNRWKIQQLQAELQVKASFTQIKLLANLEVGFVLKLKPTFPVSKILSLELLELQNLALENRADLQAVRIGEDIAQARINLAESQAKTNIDLFAKYKEERKTEDNILRFSSIERKIGGGISFSLPLYNRNQGDILEATANKTQATYLREQLEQKIKQEVTLAFAQFTNSEQAVKLFETNILPKAQDNLKILQVAYQLGDQNLIDVITEQRRLMESQKDYLTVQKDYYLSLIALEKAVGIKVN
ncbi:MAG: TolC family protein [Acidobacteria bacterium]|nr:TolC family protein [Acidobacteriota bacterium]